MVSNVNEDEKQKLLNLETELAKYYVNQRLAVSSLADALRRGRLDIADRDRPVGAFLFVGPTGVGKTELARRLAEVYFGNESNMIRLDMTEFSNSEMIRRIVGSAAGEQGYGEGGELTEKVRRAPSSLILLDEIEKAHPKVWNLLMQVMDEGRLTDASGLLVDFTNTIIIATSNAVTQFITDQLQSGKQLTEVQPLVFDQLLKTFNIEFLNRFDGIIPFGPLDEKHMQQIVKIQLDRLTVRLAEKQIEVKFTPELIARLAQQGTDARLGARPLRRLIQNTLESHIAKLLLAKGDKQRLTITLDADLLN